MSEELSGKISRRQFIRNTTIAAVGGMSAGVLIGCAPRTMGEATGGTTVVSSSKLPDKWDKEADVVVIGFGGAGSAAAIEATKAGASVIVVERMENGGGSTAICGGIIYMGGGTPLQKACGFDDTRDDMYNYLVAATGEGADTEKIGLFCDKSLELYDWLDQLGLKFKQTFLAGKYAALPTDDGLGYSGNEAIAEFTAIAKDVPRGHHAPAPGQSGAEIFKPLKAAVEASGAEIMYQTLARHLIKDQTGRVVGVVVDVNGAQQTIKAKKAVILTAGTYHANMDMVKQYAPAWSQDVTYVGTPGDDGSGIRMGQEVGADLNHIGAVTGFGGVYMFTEELVKGILVNQSGRRYVGEDGYGSRVGVRIVERNPNSFIITDSKVWDSIPDAAKETLNKMVVSADSIETLAASIGVPTALLISTVNDYNAMVAAGADAEFQKNEHYLSAIDQGPFYAVFWGHQIVARQAIGGLMSDINSRVLDTNHAVIPGLYSAGANTSGIISRFYPGSGTAVGSALTFGRIAGQNAAADEAWS
jgi:3-oxo-5alpha-steroid 4-dehydrogenase